MSGITLTGAAELEALLGKLGPKIGGKVLKKAMRDGAKIVHRQVRSATPKDTGQMARALTVRAAKRRRQRRGQGVVSINVVYNTKKFPGLVKRTKAGRRYFYPASVEYGTSRTPANPFFRRAWAASKGAALQKIITGLRAGLAKAVRGR